MKQHEQMQTPDFRGAKQWAPLPASGLFEIERYNQHSKQHLHLELRMPLRAKMTKNTYGFLESGKIKHLHILGLSHSSFMHPHPEPSFVCFIIFGYGHKIGVLWQLCHALGAAYRRVFPCKVQERIDWNRLCAVGCFPIVHKVIWIRMHRQHLLFRMVEELCVERGSKASCNSLRLKRDASNTLPLTERGSCRWDGWDTGHDLCYFSCSAM